MGGRWEELCSREHVSAILLWPLVLTACHSSFSPSLCMSCALTVFLLQIRQLEMQLEQEHEEKQTALREKQDLEGLVGTLCEQVSMGQGWLLHSTSSKCCTCRQDDGAHVNRVMTRPTPPAQSLILCTASLGRSIHRGRYLLVSQETNRTRLTLQQLHLPRETVYQLQFVEEFCPRHIC